jgi:hypothetical protein
MQRMFGASHGKDWEAWWRDCEHLFRPDPMVPKYTLEKLAVGKVDEWQRDYQHDHFLVSINRLATRKDIIAAFPKALTGELVKKTRREVEDRNQVFLFARPARAELADVLDVYDYYLKHPKPLWKLAEKFELGKKARDTSNMDDKRAMTVMVLSKINRAKSLIAGLKRGEFPAARPAPQKKTAPKGRQHLIK